MQDEISPFRGGESEALKRLNEIINDKVCCTAWPLMWILTLSLCLKKKKDSYFPSEMLKSSVKSFCLFIYIQDLSSRSLLTYVKNYSIVVWVVFICEIIMRVDSYHCKINLKLLVVALNDKNLQGNSDEEPFTDTIYLVPHITTG